MDNIEHFFGIDIRYYFECVNTWGVPGRRGSTGATGATGPAGRRTREMDDDPDNDCEGPRGQYWQIIHCTIYTVHVFYTVVLWQNTDSFSLLGQRSRVLYYV